jgi:hypothetical protein
MEWQQNTKVKSFTTLGPELNLIKYVGRNLKMFVCSELECLFLTSLSSL